MEEKRFDEWNGHKKRIHVTGRLPWISEREVWWVAVGENVGIEINGKNADFARPAIILRKLGVHGAMVVPLTSQPKEGNWYVKFVFLNKNQYAVLAQAKCISSKRLYRRMGELPENDLNAVREGFVKLYGEKIPSPREER